MRSLSGGSALPGPNAVGAGRVGLVIGTWATLLSYLRSFNMWQNPSGPVNGHAKALGPLGVGVNGGFTVIQMTDPPGCTGSCPFPPARQQYSPQTGVVT